MQKSNGSNSPQDGGKEPSFECELVTSEEKSAGQSDRDLDAKRGVSKGGSRIRSQTPPIPEGLGTGTDPDDAEPREESLDQTRVVNDGPNDLGPLDTEGWEDEVPRSEPSLEGEGKDPDESLLCK